MALREAQLCSNDSFAARLVHYSPGLRQAEHEHRKAQISFLLLGDAWEAVGRKEAEISCAASGIKPAGTRHQAMFGRNGALMLAFDFAERKEPEDHNWGEPCHWRPVPSSTVQLFASSINSSAAMREDMLWDILFGAEPTDIVRRTPPHWLRLVRERIADAPFDAAIANLAAEFRVHRVHLSREFHAAFGLPPSLYRLRCMAARALDLVNNGVPLAEAAALAGFADQSHMCRAFRKQLHMPVTQVRKLLS